jgi:hypothetical protein
MPFTTGKSGNPRGRPRKGKSLTEALEEELKKKRDSGKNGKAELAKELVSLALDKKDLAAMKYVYDRLDGKSVETIRTKEIKEDPLAEMTVDELIQYEKELDEKARLL